MSSSKRSPVFPSVPTIAETYPGFDAVTWFGILAPAGTPRPVIDKLNAEINRALRDPAVAGKFAELGAQIVPEAKQSPAGLRDWLKSEIDKWGPVIRQAGTFAD